MLRWELFYDVSLYYKEEALHDVAVQLTFIDKSSTEEGKREYVVKKRGRKW